MPGERCLVLILMPAVLFFLVLIVQTIHPLFSMRSSTPCLLTLFRFLPRSYCIYFFTLIFPHPTLYLIFTLVLSLSTPSPFFISATHIFPCVLLFFYGNRSRTHYIRQPPLFFSLPFLFSHILFLLYLSLPSSSCGFYILS